MTSSAFAWADDVCVSSPSDKLKVNVSDAGGRLYYSVTFDGQEVLQPSALGLKTSVGDFTKSLSIVDTQNSTISESYQMRGTKASSASYKANTLTLNLQNKDGRTFSILFQVSDHDIAFRYQIPRQKINKIEYKRARILSELSSFNFPEATTTFISPQIGPETGWEQTKPSYEEGYSADAPMAVESQYGHGYIFPALFHLPHAWVLVSETGVGSNYCGAHLSDYQAGIGYTVAYPDKGENNGFGADFAGIPLPGETPWRTITVGNSLKPIVETTVSYDVVKPLYEPSCHSMSPPATTNLAVTPGAGLSGRTIPSIMMIRSSSSISPQPWALSIASWITSGTHRLVVTASQNSPSMPSPRVFTSCSGITPTVSGMMPHRARVTA